MASTPHLEIVIKGNAEQAQRSMQDLQQAVKASMQNIQGEGNQTGAALDAAFRTLGVKGVKQVEAEVVQLQKALDQIKRSDALPADKQAAVEAYKRRVAELRSQLQPTSSAMQQMGEHTTRAGNSLAAAAHKAVAWTAALAGLNNLADIGRQVIETGSQFETLQMRLESLLGSTEAANKAFAMIKQMAIDTPFEVSALTESFATLTAFGLQPTESQMQALSDTAANLGGGTEMLSRVTLALGQAWTKAKLQGGEIMQLAEAGVPVWDALARATGRTVPELQRMSEAGALGRDVIAQLIDELGRMNTGASAKLMNTYAGAVSNAKDALAEFFDLIAQSGVLEFLTAQLQDLLAEFDRMKETGELQAKAQAIADTFLNIASAASGLVQILSDLGPLFVQIGKIAIASKLASFAQSFWGMARAATAARTGLLGVATSAGAASRGMTAVSGTSTAAAGSMTAAAAAGTRLATVLRVLRSLTGIGLAIGAAEMAAEFLRARRAAQAADRAVTKMLESTPARNAPKEAAQQAADAAQAMGHSIQGAVHDAIAQFDSLTAKGDSAASAMAKIGKELATSSQEGVAIAAQALDELQRSGRISAAQFAQAWDEALKSTDLLTFQTHVQIAFGEGVLGAEQMAAAVDASLREAVRRAGLDMAVISGGMGRAAQLAINDVEAIITQLDKLKQQGVDVSLALSASISKAINTADSAKALNVLRAQIESVRHALGDRVADGLLEQAETRARALTAELDKARGGINSLNEAMQTLGLKSREELQATANKARAAYDTILRAGQQEGESYLAWQERKRKAAEAALRAMIDGNGGVVSSEIRTRAAVEGVRLKVDELGRASIDAASKTSSAAGQMSRDWGRVEGAANRAASAASRAASAAAGGKRLTATERKDAADKAAAEADRAQRLAGQNAVDTSALVRLRELANKNQLHTLGEADLTEIEAVIQSIEANAATERIMAARNPAAFSLEHYAETRELERIAQRLRERTAQIKAAANKANNTDSTPPPPRSRATDIPAAPAAPPTPATTQPIQTIRIELPNGQSAEVLANGGAQALIEMLKAGKAATGRNW